MWYQIDVGYACGGIEEREGIIVDAPPIFKWMIGKELSFVMKWIRKKRGKVTGSWGI